MPVEITITVIGCIASFIWGYVHGKSKGRKMSEANLRKAETQKTVAYIDGKYITT